MRKKTIVRGVEYPSRTQACKEYGITQQAVNKRIRVYGISASNAIASPRTDKQWLPVTFGDQTAKTMDDFERLFGIRYLTYTARRRKGWSAERAISERVKDRTSPIGFERVNVTGYVAEKVSDGDCKKYPNAIKQGGAWALQHRIVWCRHNNRDLFDGENIHHLNGDRTDNRIENLELWSTSQPYGQRVADKLKWAREILELYG